MSSDETTLICIPPSQVKRVWPIAEPLLKKAYDRTPQAQPHHARRRIEKEDAQLWLVWVPLEQEALAAVVTSIQNYPTGYRVVRVEALGGHEMRRWRHLLATIEEFARDEGCDAVELVGRAGWGKIYPEYAETFRTFVKEI